MQISVCVRQGYVDWERAFDQ